MDRITDTEKKSPESSYYISFTAEEFEGYERRMNNCRSPGSRSLDSSDNTNSGAKLCFEPQNSVREDLNEAKDGAQLSLPAKRQSRYIRAVRHTLWNVYRRLFSIVFLANVAALIALLCTTKELIHINLWHLATATSTNIWVGTTIRQDCMQIILYKTAWLVPHSAPLRLRRIVAKLYENGGVHSGCGVAGAMWFTALTVLLTIQFTRLIFTSVAILVLTYVLQTLFMVLLVLAYPSLRSKYHNAFEVTHRFLGWTITILFWVELGLLASTDSLATKTPVGTILVEQPAFWFLILITIHTILPWLNLHRWEFSPENLSKHAVRLHFKQTVSPYTGIAISKSPLFEWHPFATMPSLSGEPTGGSLIVSSAGDWTKQTVESPKTSYWVKGYPKPGVLGMSLIFRQVVVVTTGSGIGPCLSILASKHRRTECRVLWSSPSPLGIFGEEIVGCVKRVDADARIIDTKKEGRPDMVMLAYRMYVEAEAEAVFVISNPSLTKKIVYAMECRGVPAFGPVWDS
ncbi:integral membrane protein TmpA [Periconia macrospinosa]|uniref:Integral membrane protein TmpA n=1 Tax=Periconia macrospinosa TaxID=97972 RepID=A0A2V1CY94_9PLEO|nr:integral membrane protein TmpA [Periconia macrospinosa]